jgi:hypothetical protein
VSAAGSFGHVGAELLVAFKLEERRSLSRDGRFSWSVIVVPSTGQLSASVTRTPTGMAEAPFRDAGRTDHMRILGRLAYPFCGCGFNRKH